MTSLKDTIQDMLRIGIIAADESHGTHKNPKTIERRLMYAGIPYTEQDVNAWRELVRDAPALEKYTSGVILEESRVQVDAPIFAEKGIVPGVKVDQGTGGKVGVYAEALTIGLDGLEKRLALYQSQGAKFAKFRTITQIGNFIPTRKAINANMEAIARYAKKCQNQGIVPICEPEVLITGAHSIDRCDDITRKVLTGLFEKMDKYHAKPSEAILKSSMIIWGQDYTREGNEKEMKEVAERTMNCFEALVPRDMGGIVFLSGGQRDRESVMHLNYMAQIKESKGIAHPYPLTFSYSRYLQDTPMRIWQGKPENLNAARENLIKRAEAVSKASRGEFKSSADYKI